MNTSERANGGPAIRDHFGIVLGRLQPLHVGHMEYLRAARLRCHCLVIGITNPTLSDLLEDPTDVRRSKPKSNPFSYFDRVEMVTASLIEDGWLSNEFLIVPADVNRPSTLVSYLPKPQLSTVFLTIYDEWGERKAAVMRSQGYAVVVLWRRSMDQRVTSGTKIREMMGRHEDGWRALVPNAVANYLDSTGRLLKI